jgi:UDP-2,3-diacylglucosamine pyrophosphatase LpxH
MACVDEIIRLTSRKPVSINALCLKLAVNETTLKRVVTKGQKEGYGLLWLDGFVATKVAVGPVPGSTNHRVDAPPGRKVVGHMTDLHAGSKHYDKAAHLDYLRTAWDRGARVMLCTGDNLDGLSDKLTADQECSTFDGQTQILIDVLKQAPRFRYYTITGNHDGYYDSKIGTSSGRIVADRMQEAGIHWHHTGVCRADVNVYGAQIRLWHPHGGGSNRNILRRTMNAQVEKTHSRMDVLLMGHFHKHVPLVVFPEPTFCMAGGTFQTKKSEFANRISGEWDIGASLLFFTKRADGSVGEFSSEFLYAKDAPR